MKTIEAEDTRPSCQHKLQLRRLQDSDPWSDWAEYGEYSLRCRACGATVRSHVVSTPDETRRDRIARVARLSPGEQRSAAIERGAPQVPLGRWQVFFPDGNVQDVVGWVREECNGAVLFSPMAEHPDGGFVVPPQGSYELHQV